jgi:hypothetical protein
MAVGALLAVVAAWDGAGGTSQNVAHELGVYDDAGNIYTAVYGLDFFAGPGPWSSIHLCQLQFPLTTSSVITLKYAQARSVQVCQLWEFSLDAGMVWAVTDRAPIRIAGSGALLSLPLAGLDNQEYLFLYAGCVSGPSTDTINFDAGWTTFGPIGTTGGADASNRALFGEFKIATTTNETTNVTDSTAGRDYTEGLVAICQCPEIAAFPTTPTLDTFNRADENPLDNGTWDPACFAGEAAYGLRLVSDEVATPIAGGHPGQWWGTQMVQNDAESFVTLTVVAAAEVDSIAWLMEQGGGCVSGNDITGFANAWYKQNASMPGDCCFAGTLGGFGNMTNERIISYLARVVDCRMGLRKAGQVIHQLLDNGGGSWTRTGGWYVNTAIYFPWNPTHAKIGIGITGPSVRLDDFGGGSFVPPPVAGAHLLPFLHVGP